MKKQVLKDIVDNQLLSAGDSILVAVSGGPDSIALLHLLREIAAQLSLVLVAAHLDHGLRPRSDKDARFVAELCQEWDIPLVQERIAVADLNLPGSGGLEQVARQQRRRFLEENAQRLGCSGIALGHHRDDQAETVLHRLVRGSGPAGLASMRPRAGLYVRPLLAVSRRQILEYLRNHDLPWCHDESNEDERFTRNRIRHQLLPLCRSFNPRVDEALSRLAGRLAREEAYWQEQVSLAVAEWPVQPGYASVPRNDLNSLHPALRDRVLRHLIAVVHGHLRGVDEKHVAALTKLAAAGGEGHKEMHLPGLTAFVRYDEFCLASGTLPVAAPYHRMIDTPGQYDLPGGWRVRFLLIEQTMGDDGRTAIELDANQIPFPLVLRSWEHGDRMTVTGMRGHRKLKNIFIDEKVPREIRRHCPVLVRHDEILWLAGLRRCRDHLPDKKTKKILRVELVS